MSVYPKWLYHKSEEPKVVKSKEEHEALGKGWEESPEAFAEKKAEASKADKDSKPDKEPKKKD